MIQLLEELRRDMPQVSNRFDREAAEMARPADPEVMLEAIKEIQVTPDVDSKAAPNGPTSDVASSAQWGAR